MNTTFVTGYPGFIGKRLVKHLTEADPDRRICLLVQPRFLQEAQAYVSRLPGKVEILQGDIVDLHLGLAGEEYSRLCEDVTEIFHLAAISYLGMPRETARKVNVDGTRQVLELGRDCRRLKRLVHFSTAYVSGDRVGVIAEDELDVGQGFRNVYEQTKFEAEQLVRRWMPKLPITVVRPTTVVGDSRTGEIDRFDGPYYLGMVLVLSPLVVPLPLPGDGVAPLNVVPVDFVVQAARVLARNPLAEGKTVHLVDPNPMSARRAYELIAARANKKLPRFNLSARAASAFLKLPGLERLARPQRAAINYVNHLALYSSHGAIALLDGSGVRCPPLHSYLDKLVDFARDTYARRKALVDPDDPLDQPARSR